MNKLVFASKRQKLYRTTIKRLSSSIRVSTNMQEIEFTPMTPKDKLAYKAIVFGRFINNRIVESELTDLLKEFVHEFKQIPEHKRRDEWIKLSTLVNEMP